jgi:hypothetical protein
MRLKKNTAAQEIILGPVLNTSDSSFVSDASVVKVRAAGVTTTGAGALTYLSAGQYAYVPTQAETNHDVVVFWVEKTAAVCPLMAPLMDAWTNSEWITNIRAEIDAALADQGVTANVLERLDATISSRASQTSLDSRPTNPLLATDTRLLNLDAKISELPDVTAINDQLSLVHGAGSWEMTGEGAETGSIEVTSFSSQALSQLAGVQMTVTSPLLEDGTICLVQGDDYVHADLRSIDVQGSQADQWPDLTDASATLIWRQKDDVRSFDGQILTSTGMQHLRWELTSEQTTMPIGWWDYQIQVELQSSRLVTIVQGRGRVLEHLGPEN